MPSGSRASGPASSAETSSSRALGDSAHPHASTDGEWETVFNLTVEDAHVYYANGVLTHNCDVFAYLGIMINDVSAPAKASAKPKKSWKDKLKKLANNAGEQTWMSS